MSERKVLKKIMVFFLCFFMILGNIYFPNYVKADAAEISNSNNFKYELVGNTAVITGLKDKNVSEVHIPRRIDGIWVAGIADKAFLFNRNITEVTLPDSLTYIGQQAFSMTSIKEIVIPGSVKTIKLKAFQNCQSLEKVTILYGVQNIEDGAFASCGRLSKVEIAPSVEEMKSNTFNHVSNVEIQAEPDSPVAQFEGNGDNVISHKKLADDSSVVYAYDTDEAGNVTIKGYYGSSKTPTIPGSINGNLVTGIGNGAFQNKPINEAHLPDSITNIGSNAFAGTNIEYLFIPKNVTSLGDNIIDNKENLVIESESAAVEEYISKHFPEVRFVPYGPGMTSYHMLTVTTNGGGSITKGVTAKYKDGKAVKISAVPNKKYSFVRWVSSGGGTFEDPTMAETTFSMPNTEVTITAIFEKSERPDFIYKDGVLVEFNLSGVELIIPERYARSDTDSTKVPVTAINPTAFCHYVDNRWYYGQPTKIEIPASMETIPYGVFKSCYYLTSINVKENNPYYTSEDGVLFNKDMTELIAYPRAKKGESYIIPDTVTKIAPYAFYKCEQLTSVELSRNLETIGYEAFEFCSNLRNVLSISYNLKTIEMNAFNSCIRLEHFTIPKNVESIGAYAFKGCSSLESITVEEGNKRYSDDEGVLIDNESKTLLYYPRLKTNITYSVPDNIERIDSYAFYYASRLKEVILPQSVLKINDAAFEACYELEKINIPDKVTVINANTFQNCNALKEMKLPNSVTGIGAYAFSRCYALQNITIPDQVNRINEGAFTYCTSLKEIKLPKNLVTLGYSAFQYCSGLGQVTIPSGIKTIEYRVFAGCTSLNQVDLPQGLEKIADDAFIDCKSLTEIELFENVNNIDPRAFYNCTALKEFKVAVNNQQYSQVSGVLFNKYQTTLVCYPIARETADGKYVIPNGTKKILDDSFAHTNLKVIDVPKQVQDIGYRAFSYCKNLQNLIFRNKNTILNESSSDSDCLVSGVDKHNLIISGYIDSTAEYFAYTHKMKFRQINDITKDLVVNASGEVVGYTGSETELIIPSTIESEDGSLITVTTIGRNAFKNPDDLDDRNFERITEVKLPLSITTIKDSAFDGMKGLNNSGLVLPESVQTIGAYAFNGCSGLTEVTIPENVSVLNSSAFDECNNLVSIHIASGNYNYADIDGVLTNKAKTEIQLVPVAFAGKDGVYDIPESIVSVKAGAMHGCKGIKTVNISNIDLIEQGAFRGAFTEPVEINLANVDDIDNYAFADCDGISTITIPKSVTRIGDGVFSGCNNLREINVDSDNTIFMSKDGVLLTKDGLSLISYPKAKPDHTYQIPDGIKQIYANAFFNCTGLEEIIMPDTVLLINTSAFENCNFMSIGLSKNIEKIEDKAFANNNMLSSIEIPESAVSIGASAFYGCTRLNDVTVYSKDVIYSDKGEIFNQDMIGGEIPLLTLHGYLGSTTEKYTEGRNINFAAIDSEEPEIPVITGGAVKEFISKEDSTFPDEIQPENIEHSSEGIEEK